MELLAAIDTYCRPKFIVNSSHFALAEIILIWSLVSVPPLFSPVMETSRRRHNLTKSNYEFQKRSSSYKWTFGNIFITNCPYGLLLHICFMVENFRNGLYLRLEFKPFKWSNCVRVVVPEIERKFSKIVMELELNFGSRNYLTYVPIVQDLSFLHFHLYHFRIMLNLRYVTIDILKMKKILKCRSIDRTSAL